jgi:RNA polymerase sigma-70 factor (ECF subfamily)
LPPEQKEAIILQDIMGFSQKEICEIQSISLDALKQRLYRGRKKLAELLNDEFSEFTVDSLKLSAKGDRHV